MGSFDATYIAAQLRQNKRLAREAHNRGIRDLHLEYCRVYQALLDQEEQPARDRPS